MSSPPDRNGAPRLALSQMRRIRRIVDEAVSLAEKGGFDGVRLRDVAEASGVALGTLYKYFHSKEEVLLFALNEDMERLEAVVTERPPLGADPVARLTAFFARATRGLTRRPDFARAVLRSVAASDASTAIQQAGFHLRMSRMIIATMRGEKPIVDRPLSEPVGDSRDQQISLVLEHVWFASLLGWASGLHPARAVSDRMRDSVALVLGAAPPQSLDKAPAPGHTARN
jgi:AcrR family transcriptional regulator